MNKTITAKLHFKYNS